MTPRARSQGYFLARTVALAERKVRHNMGDEAQADRRLGRTQQGNQVVMRFVKEATEPLSGAASLSRGS